MKEDREFVTLKIGRNRYRKVFLDDIIYLKADRAYTIVKLYSTKFVLSETLKNFETLFENNDIFLRANRSYIINLNKCNEFKNCSKPEIIMEDEEIIYPNEDILHQILTHFEVK